jgi:hypothetical protein
LTVRSAARRSSSLAAASPRSVLTVVPRRHPGLFKGQLQVTDAFFEPLPDDELKLWGEE